MPEPAIEPAMALDWIKAQSGRHFDPVVTDAFLVVAERIRKAEPDWLPVPETPAAAALAPVPEAAALEARPPGLGDGLRRWVGCLCQAAGRGRTPDGAGPVAPLPESTRHGVMKKGGAPTAPPPFHLVAGQEIRN